MGAEQKLIGQIIESGGQLYSDVSIRDKHLADPLCKRVFRAIGKVLAAGGEVDLMTIADADQQLNPAELAELTNDITTYSNWKFYQKKVLEAWQKRTLRRMAEYLKTSDDTPEQMIEKAEKALDLLNHTESEKKITDRRETHLEWEREVDKRYTGGGELPGIKTGIHSLDAYIMGFKQTCFYLIGGRPSTGKSAMLLQMANNISIDSDIPVGFISLESGEKELLNRTYANRARVPSQLIEVGKLNAEDFRKMHEAGEVIHNSRFYTYDESNARLDKVISIARQMVRRFAVKILFLDYIQLVRVPGARDRTAQTQEVSMAMKDLARRLNVPVVCAAQLGRDSAGSAPELKDFQHSSQIEQDADAALLLHDDREGQKWIYVSKNRNGETGRIKVLFQGQYVNFEEAV